MDLWDCSHGSAAYVADVTLLARALRFLIDLVIPLVLYYVLRAAGASVFVALLAGAIVSAASGLWQLVHSRRVGGLATYMTVMLVGSLVIALISGSERFLLAKGAVLTGVTGLWFIGSLWTRRPLAYHFSKPLIEGRLGWPGGWDEMWDRSAAFRRMWRVSSVLWGVGTLFDAAARVWMSYHLDPDRVPILGNALYAVTALTLIVITNIWYFACGIANRSSAIYRAEDGSSLARQ